MKRVPKHATVNLPTNGATDRFQLPDVMCYSATVQAKSTNAGPIYVGDSTVTNAGGASPGIKLDADELVTVSVVNLNGLFAATDTNNDKLIYLAT